MRDISERALYAPTLATRRRTIEISPSRFAQQGFQIVERYTPFAFESAWPSTGDHDTQVWDFLESVEDGWDEGKGKAPSREGLRWLKNSQLVLLLRLHMDAPPPWNIQMEGPAVFPMTSGDVEFAWEENERSASLKVDLDTRQGRLHLFDNVTFESKHSDYYFKNNDSVWEIVSEIYSHLASE